MSLDPQIGQRASELFFAVGNSSETVIFLGLLLFRIHDLSLGLEVGFTELSGPSVGFRVYI